MSVIAKAIADRQSEIERLQGEIQALNDVDKMLVTSAPSKPAARRSSSRRPAAAATPVAETASDAKPTREAPTDDGRREEGGFRADDSLLGRAQKESREVARRGRAASTCPVRGRCILLTAFRGRSRHAARRAKRRPPPLTHAVPHSHEVVGGRREGHDTIGGSSA